ncbi:MAG: hypothetical protein AMS14_09415 [Planctomycetes bacterium DG_20]|nr:MAG: hypothetical protein AMS14_09415 [Planctomycetes bacterium DG_20]
MYHLVGRETRNPGHKPLTPFSLRFLELSPYAVIEILDLTDAQQERFLKAYDITKLALGRLRVFPKNEEERRQAMETDEQESGHPPT